MTDIFMEIIWMKIPCVLGPTTLKTENIFNYFNISGTKQVKHLQCITDAQIYLG